MLCEKCGKNNLSDATKCSSCGEPMPQQEKCNGFADILTYTPPETSPVSDGYSTIYNAPQTEGISEQEMKKIIKKTDNIINFSQKNIIISLASVVIGLVVILFSMYTIGEINSLEKKISSLTPVETEDYIPDQEISSTGNPDLFENPNRNITSLKADIENYKKTTKPEDYSEDKLNEFLAVLTSIDKSKLSEKEQETFEKCKDELFECYIEYFEEQEEKCGEDKEELGKLKAKLEKFKNDNSKIFGEKNIKKIIELIKDID